MTCAPCRSRFLGKRAAIYVLASVFFFSGSASAEPLLPVPGDAIASDVTVSRTEIGIAFGFRVRNTTARSLWKIVSDYKRYPRWVDGLQKVTVKGRGKTKTLRLRGRLLDPYDVRAKVTASYSAAEGGALRWVAVDERPPSTGRMRVDPDGADAIFSLRTRVAKTVRVPDFLILLGLKAAMQAVGDGVRKSLVRERGRGPGGEPAK